MGWAPFTKFIQQGFYRRSFKAFRFIGHCYTDTTGLLIVLYIVGGEEQ